MVTPKFTVAVCGGGIAGLTTAIAISRFSSEKRDIHVNIYEAAPEFTEFGAGVGMFRRPWQAMKSLGLEEELGKLVEIPSSEDKSHLTFEMHKSDQAKGVSFYDMIVPMGVLTFHRPAFLDTLVGQLDLETTNTYFSKRLISYVPPSKPSTKCPITLLFKDGSSATCDILIGSDGIHSATRHTLLELAAQDAEASNDDEGKKAAEMLRGVMDPVWSGSVAYRGVVPREQLEKLNPNHRAMHAPQNYMGKHKHLIVFPISKGRLINVVVFLSWPDKDGTIFEGLTVEERTQTELLEQFIGWEDEVQQILQCMEKPSRWAINVLKGLPVNVHDRVALVGDAAHAMTPHQGSGAGQAIEDAYVLAALLAHPLTTLDTLHEALKAYEAERLPHVNNVQSRSRLSGMLYEFSDPRFANMDLGEIKWGQLSEADVRKLWEIGHEAVENWKWAWTTDIEDDKERAIRTFEERIGKV